MSDQADLLRRAEQVLPGGILGSHRSGPGLEFVVKEGRGAYLWDMNGRRYLDYLLGSGPMLLGHAHPAVVEAVERQIARGTSYFLLNEPAIQLAEEIVKAVPCAEQVRYTTSGRRCSSSPTSAPSSRPRASWPGCGRRRAATTCRSSSTRSSPAFASPTAAPRSTM